MKTIATAVLSVLFLLSGSAAQAQHGKPQQHSAPKAQHGRVHNDRGQRTSQEDRRHFDGRRFDAGFERAHFGREHAFFVSEPVFIGGGYRFWYGGFWFSYDAWPVGWDFDQSVYIDQENGIYFLYNPYHPGARIAVNVVF
jgi:hypothetical protein